MKLEYNFTIFVVETVKKSSDFQKELKKGEQSR